jgi:predicted dehydrogenase
MGIGVGVIGCGSISDEYIRGLRMFDVLEVVACADLEPERARALAATHGISRTCTPPELINSREVQVVVNLTPPLAHKAVSLEAISAGKHVYSEKPLATTPIDGREIVAAAAMRHVMLGCAPDTFLGDALQTCRAVIDQGAIGRPVAAVACYAESGHEDWHPDPRFFYGRGGGPNLDMGPYYVTALVSLLGSARRVSGSVGTAHGQRTIGSQPLRGSKISVKVPTHIAGTVEFSGGVIATIVASWDVYATTMPHIEIYGTEGSLSVPDPNEHSGAVRLRTKRTGGWEEVAVAGLGEVRRGIGVADMARALLTGRPHRATGELSLHVLEILCAFERSSISGRHVVLDTDLERPAPISPSERCALQTAGATCP